MKRIILTLLAIVSFALSINAQKYHVQEDRNRQYITYGWGQGAQQVFLLYKNGQQKGKIITKVKADKSITFTAEGCSPTFSCYTSHVNADMPDSPGGGQLIELSLSAGQTYTFTNYVERKRPIIKLRIKEMTLKSLR